MLSPEARTKGNDSGNNGSSNNKSCNTASNGNRYINGRREMGGKEGKALGERKEAHCVTLLADKLFGGAFDVVRTAERT